MGINGDASWVELYCFIIIIFFLGGRREPKFLNTWTLYFIFLALEAMHKSKYTEAHNQNKSLGLKAGK